MVPLALAPAAIQAITGIGQLIGGKRQLREAERNRPMYEMPDAIKVATALAKAQYADQFMPGEGRMLDQNALAGANAAAAAINGGGGLSSIAGIQAQQSAGAQNIGIASAQSQQTDQANYANALNTYANYKDQEWQMNKYAPWAAKYNEARERIGAGQQNLYGAADSFGKYAIAASFMNQGSQPPSAADIASGAAASLSTTRQFTGQYDNLSYSPPGAEDALKWWSQNSYKFLPKL